MPLTDVLDHFIWEYGDILFLGFAFLCLVAIGLLRAWFHAREFPLTELRLARQERSRAAAAHEPPVLNGHGRP